jgi:hypothetical protein
LNCEWRRIRAGRLTVHRADQQLGVRLAVALVLLVVFTTTHLEDAHFVVLTVSHNSGVDACARNQGSANFQFCAATDSKNLVEHILLANIRSNLFYLDLFASRNFVLLAAGFYDRVHISPFSEITRALLAVADNSFGARI